MEEFNQKDRHNLLRQLAILEVTAQAEGKRAPEIRAMLRDAFASRSVPEGPTSWMDAVANAAASGEPYIISAEAAAAAANVLNPAPEPPRPAVKIQTGPAGAAPRTGAGPAAARELTSDGGRARAQHNPVLLALAWLPALLATAVVRLVAAASAAVRELTGRSRRR